MIERHTTPYTCPQCGYATRFKTDMQRHFKRSKPCPANHNIFLTEEIRLFVLTYRVYNPPRAKIDPSIKEVKIQQTTNNCVINFINSQLSPIELITKYAEYNRLTLIPLEDKIEDRYEDEVCKMHNDTMQTHDHFRNIEDFHNVIDEITTTKTKDHTDIGIIYDTEMNKINILDCDGNWKQSLETQGLGEILWMVQDKYFDEYECYLIQKIRILNNLRECQKFREFLRDYYRFICAFDLQPFCKDHNDSYFLPDCEDANAHSCEEEFYDMFQKVRKNMKTIERNKIEKKVADIVKRNSTKNMKVLNNHIAMMFSTDAVFKDFMTKNCKNEHLLQNA
jgi:hypothetical protein